MAQEHPLIYERMAKVMQELPAIGKNQKNRDQGFQFRGIDDIYDALHSLMAKHQIISTPKIIAKDRYEGKTAKGTAFVDSDLTIGYTFWTVDGSSVYAESVGVGRDYADKYASKAMAIAHKYALVQVFCIATNEPDNDPDNSYIEGKADKAPKQHEPTRKSESDKEVKIYKRPSPKQEELIKSLISSHLFSDAEKSRYTAVLQEDGRDWSGMITHLSGLIKDREEMPL